MNLRYFKNLIPVAAVAFAVAGLSSCTKDLDVTPIDPSTVMTPSEPELFTKCYATMAVAGNYGGDGKGAPKDDYVCDINRLDGGTTGFVRQMFNANELTTDEAICAWGDPGIPEFNYNSWGASHPMLEGFYNRLYTSIAFCNHYLDVCNGIDATRTAEVRFLRAMYYYFLMDCFGNVPFATELMSTSPEQIQRADLFKWIESELLEVKDQMQAPVARTSSSDGYGRADQDAANLLLARLYLNAEVFTGTPRWQDCLDACNKVKGYSLASNYKQNFFIENEKSPEIIFAIQYDHAQGTVGNYLGSMSYHYNQKLAFSPTGNWQWSGNGICAQPGIFSSYEEGDVRRDLSILSGQQKSAADGSDVLMDDGSPLNYTEEIVNYVDAKQNEGVRLDKYEWSVDDAWERDNDWVLMRYAEILMMQAEASYRLGYEGAALGYINQIRQRAHLPALTSLTLNDLDNEWKHEFVFEGLRRNVNIRFGTYFQPWWAKGDSYAKDNGYPIVDESDHHTAIYPIPQEEMQKNPNLVQNPGY